MEKIFQASIIFLTILPLKIRLGEVGIVFAKDVWNKIFGSGHIQVEGRKYIHRTFESKNSGRKSIYKRSY
ncbi:unnamed protein product [Lactuca virosa]|uniref:Secreted protein n=1 Tax=Lactuca virosa TaxID=75947 RepID=A0AAU9LY98_9ASTR|nr:unnamed protein product [Lactuca virosa]